VVLAIGAAAKEHGPHLPLETDYVIAQHLLGRVVASADVVAAPTISYSFYPAFVEYPGSTNVSLSVARDMLCDVVRSIARHGPRRFYVVNAGVSTNRVLAEAKGLLAVEGILLAYSDDFSPAMLALSATVETQQEGTHAEELETSMMLAIAPTRVD